MMPRFIPFSVILVPFVVTHSLLHQCIRVYLKITIKLLERLDYDNQNRLMNHKQLFISI